MMVVMVMVATMVMMGVMVVTMGVMVVVILILMGEILCHDFFYVMLGLFDCCEMIACSNCFEKGEKTVCIHYHHHFHNQYNQHH